MLEVRDVHLAFGRAQVLEGVSLSLRDGEIVALVGPSGSGKSTLLRVIAGIVSPDTGDILVDGAVITGVPTHRRHIGMVFQDEQLFPHRSVADNIAFGLRMARWPRPRREERVQELLELVGLHGFEGRRVGELSGGEAKRVALARTLAPSPRIVLLDEPLTGLDRDLHQQLAVELSRILRSTGATALLVTHDRHEAELIADRIIAIGELSRPGDEPIE